MIDDLFGPVWSKDFTCLAFVAQAWPVITGKPFPDVVAAIDGGLARKQHGEHFTRLAAPRSPCLVSFQAGDEHHVGIFFNRRVLHLTVSGVQYMPLEIAGFTFKRIRFYDVK